MDSLILEVAIAFGLIAGAGLLGSKLRVSLVPLLVLIGMAVGPHTPSFGMGALNFKFLESAPMIDALGRLGVIFLMFYVGLEFSVGRLLLAGRQIARSGTIYVAINFTTGLLFGWALGLGYKEVLIVAGITTISSSAIVARVLVELRRTGNPETELILGIIMFEDVFLAIFIAVVSGIVLGGGAEPRSVLRAALGSTLFIFALLVVGRRLAPWFNRMLDISSDEVFLFVVLTILLLVAGASTLVHVAEPIGALLAGLVMAETKHAKRAEHLVIPFRDAFGAVFFFSFGLRIDPLSLGGSVRPALLAVLMTLVGNFVAGMIAGRAGKLSHAASANIGLTIVSRGEFSIVVANLARDGFLLAALQPFAALYVLILAILGPILTRSSKPIYRLLNALFRWEPQHA